MKKLKMLVVEDEFLSRQHLMSIVAEFGSVDVAVDGVEALRALELSYEAGAPYDLIFLDIMLPNMDGQEALRKMRAYEEARGVLASSGVKIVMATALSDSRSVMEAFKGQCEAYITKPYTRQKIRDELKKLGIVE